MFGYSKQLGLTSKEFKRNLPVNFSADHKYHFEVNKKYKCPDLYLYRFRKISFLPDSTLFLFGIWPLSISFLFYKKRIRQHSIKGVFDINRLWQRRTIKHQKSFLIIHDPWTLNYYHWMTQALPRLLLALRIEKSFILLLPKDHCKEFHLQSLRVLGVDTWIFLENHKTYYRVENLIYPSHDIQVGDYNDNLMVELALALKNGLTPVTQKTRLFIHRSSKNVRQIINEEEVLSVFNHWGFEVVEFEKLSFEEQRTKVCSASILAGVHGAGLANMLFMEKGSQILELTTALDGEQYYYYTLSNALSHRYYYQWCGQEANGKTIQEADLFIDIELLNRNIQLMIGRND